LMSRPITRRWNQLAQHLQPFRPVYVKQADPVTCCRRLRQPPGRPDRVLTGCEHDRYGRCCCLCRAYERRIDRRGVVAQARCHCRQPVILIVRQRYSIVTFWPSVSLLLKAPPECDHEGRERSGRSAMKDPTSGFTCCARRERPPPPRRRVA